MANHLKIEIDGVRLQQVKRNKYLCTIVTKEGKDDSEIKARIAMARKAFNNLERVLQELRNVQMSLRLKILNCYVWSVVRYAAETWIINKDIEKRINALEMWSYRRINRIK